MAGLGRMQIKTSLHTRVKGEVQSSAADDRLIGPVAMAHFCQKKISMEGPVRSPGLPTPPGTTLIPNFFSGAIRCKHRADQPSTVPDRGNIHLF